MSVYRNHYIIFCHISVYQWFDAISIYISMYISYMSIKIGEVHSAITINNPAVQGLAELAEVPKWSRVSPSRRWSLWGLGPRRLPWCGDELMTCATRCEAWAGTSGFLLGCRGKTGGQNFEDLCGSRKSRLKKCGTISPEMSMCQLPSNGNTRRTNYYKLTERKQERERERAWTFEAPSSQRNLGKLGSHRFSQGLTPWKPCAPRIHSSSTCGAENALSWL